MWLALTIFAAAVLASIFTIETDFEARKDRTRQCWWPYDGKDKGLRK